MSRGIFFNLHKFTLTSEVPFRKKISTAMLTPLTTTVDSSYSDVVESKQVKQDKAMHIRCIAFSGVVIFIIFQYAQICAVKDNKDNNTTDYSYCVAIIRKLYIVLMLYFHVFISLFY